MSGFVGGHGSTDVVLRHRPGRGRWLTAAAMACAAFAVLVGVLLMHSVPMVHPPAGHGVAGVSTATVTHPASHDHTALADLTALGMHGAGVVMDMGCGDGCSPHTGMAMCMAVVSVVATLLMTRRLVAHLPTVGGAHQMTWTGRYTSRAPPWATPSLEKLSVLRI